MKRKRNGLVPIGEVCSGLGGPVKEIREASPQALHHFTQGPCCMDHPEGCLIIGFFNAGGSLNAT